MFLLSIWDIQYNFSGLDSLQTYFFHRLRFITSWTISELFCTFEPAHMYCKQTSRWANRLYRSLSGGTKLIMNSVGQNQKRKEFRSHGGGEQARVNKGHNIIEIHVSISFCTPTPLSVCSHVCVNKLNKQDFQHGEQEGPSNNTHSPWPEEIKVSVTIVCVLVCPQTHTVLERRRQRRLCTYITPQCIIISPILSPLNGGGGGGQECGCIVEVSPTAVKRLVLWDFSVSIVLI